MPSEPGRSDDAKTRDRNSGRADSLAPASGFGSVSRPQRPPYRPEEGEASRGEWWSLAKAVLICFAVLLVLAGLGMQVMSLVNTGDTSPPILSRLTG